MATHGDILRAIGHLEGKLKALETLAQRVADLERSQSWHKGAWATLFCIFGWLVRLAYAR